MMKEICLMCFQIKCRQKRKLSCRPIYLPLQDPNVSRTIFGFLKHAMDSGKSSLWCKPEGKEDRAWARHQGDSPGST